MLRELLQGCLSSAMRQAAASLLALLAFLGRVSDMGRVIMNLERKERVKKSLLSFLLFLQ